MSVCVVVCLWGCLDEREKERGEREGERVCATDMFDELMYIYAQSERNLCIIIFSLGPPSSFVFFVVVFFFCLFVCLFL